MATATPNYFRIVYSMVNKAGMINAGRQLLIDAIDEREALKLATEKLSKLYKWHKITGSYKA